MEDKKIKLSTVIIILLLIIIIAGGIYIYKLQTNEDKISNKQTEETKTNNNEYIENFNKSVSKELGKDNMIYVQLSGVDYEGTTGYVSINNNNEAEVKFFKDNTETTSKKLQIML